jgi:hypothetical protein
MPGDAGAELCRDPRSKILVSFGPAAVLQTAHALKTQLFRQRVKIGLKRIRDIASPQMYRRLPGESRQFALHQPVHSAESKGGPEMQQMPGAIEDKTAGLPRPAKPARFILSFQDDEIGSLFPQADTGAQSGKTGSDNHNPFSSIHLPPRTAARASRKQINKAGSTAAADSSLNEE